MWYLLNSNSQAVDKSESQKEGYLYYNEDYDLDVFNVTFGDIQGENLVYPTVRIKPSVELVKVVLETKYALQDVRQTQADMLLAYATGGM